MSGRPVARMQYYDKAEKKAYDIAAVYDNDNPEMAWKQNISPERAADMEARFPKMLLSEAAARCERKEGWLSIVHPKQDQQQRPKQTNIEDSIPF